MNNVEKIKPSGIFTNYIYKAIPLAFDESMSYYETLCGVLEKLKTQEEVINNNADLLLELENFVIHYFDNLDVQEEINTKLDEMVEDGTLDTIINQEIFGGINDSIDELQIESSRLRTDLNTTNSNVINNRNDINDLEETKANANDFNNFVYVTNRDLNILSSRVDEIATLPEGSTTGDAELIDGRTGWQGQKFVSIGQAIRDQFENYDNQVESVISKDRSINLFNKFDVIPGYSLDVSGNPTPNATAYVSNYIAVEPGDVLVPTSHVTRCYYDSSKVFIERRTSSSTNETVPAGAYFVRFVTTNVNNNTTNINRFVVYKSDGVTTDSKTNIPYYKYNALQGWQNQSYFDIGDAIQTQLKALFDESSNYVTRTRTINLFNKYDMLLNKTLKTYGNIDDSSVYHISNFIEVDQGDVLVASAPTYRAYYDENKNFLELKQAVDGNIDTIPAGVKYVRYNIWQIPGQNTSVDSMVVYKSTGSDDLTAKTGIPYYEYKIQTNDKKFLSRLFKKVVCCGDSYTAGYIDIREGGVGDYDPQCEDFAYPEFMSKLTGNQWLNAGKSGANVLTWQTDPLGLTRAQSYGKAQAYIIGLMINDQSSGPNHVNLGTVSDIGTDNQTYYGGMSKIISRLLLINPDAKIFVCTCPNDNVSYDDYNQAVRVIVNYFRTNNNTNVHCLDLRANIDLYKNNSVLNQDFIHSHYTAIGYEVFSEILNEILSEYIAKNVTEFQDVAFIDYHN